MRNDELSIEDLPGVGPKGAQKLRESGYENLMAIAAASTKELVNACGIGDITAQKIIEAAKESMGEGGFKTAEDIMKQKQQRGFIATGSENLNTLLGGGVETQSITEAYGAFGCGKSQIGFQLAVIVQLPKEKGGLNGKCLFLDTESTFRPERITQISENIGVDPKKILKNILIAKVYNSDHQMVLLDKAKEIIKSENIKLIVVDSLMSHFRADYVGRGELHPRQQKLNRFIHGLQRMADIYNIAIFVTNQVMARPDMMFGDPTIHIGGHIVAHGTGSRLYLRKGKAGTKIARLVDSSYLPEGEAVFRINEKGIGD